MAERMGGSSYLSASDHRLHFGLGDSVLIESVEVRWPSGRIDRYTGLAADRGYLLREGDPVPRALSGKSWLQESTRREQPRSGAIGAG